MNWNYAGQFQIDAETVVTTWECSECGADADSERGLPAACACELGHSLDCLRILAGQICGRCWEHDGEIIPAPFLRVPYYGPVEHECAACDAREPGDQGIDDGPLSFAERCAENEREFRGLR